MPNNPNAEKNLKKFKAGDKRINRKGRPPVLPLINDMVAKVLLQEKNGITGLEAIVNALTNKAAKGDVRAAQELMDRYYGKPKQTMDVTSGGEKIIMPVIKIERK
jgi:hypothetical protein